MSEREYIFNYNTKEYTKNALRGLYDDLIKNDLIDKKTSRTQFYRIFISTKQPLIKVNWIEKKYPLLYFIKKLVKSPKILSVGTTINKKPRSIMIECFLVKGEPLEYTHYNIKAKDVGIAKKKLINRIVSKFKHTP